MKGGLLVPTGNIECDLVSFVADRQHSATSRIICSSRAYNLSEGPVSDNGSRYYERHARPSTELPLRSPHNSEHQSRPRSAHVLRRAICCKSRGCDDHEEMSRQRATFPFDVRQCLKTGQETASIAGSKLDVGKDLILSPSLQNNVSRAHNDGNDGEKELFEDHHANLNLKLEKFAGSRVKGNATNSLTEPKKSQRRHIKPRKGVKKSKERVKWNKSLLPLPTGSDFDSLVRSGVIAKHIAKKERKQG